MSQWNNRGGGSGAAIPKATLTPGGVRSNEPTRLQRIPSVFEVASRPCRYFTREFRFDLASCLLLVRTPRGFNAYLNNASFVIRGNRFPAHENTYIDAPCRSALRDNSYLAVASGRFNAQRRNVNARISEFPSDEATNTDTEDPLVR